VLLRWGREFFFLLIFLSPDSLPVVSLKTVFGAAGDIRGHLANLQAFLALKAWWGGLVLGGVAGVITPVPQALLLLARGHLAILQRSSCC
jgi:hypothetical protein